MRKLNIQEPHASFSPFFISSSCQRKQLVGQPSVEKQLVGKQLVRKQLVGGAAGEGNKQCWTCQLQYCLGKELNL